MASHATEISIAMNPAATKVLRWILFLPAAFAAGFIAQLLASLEQFFLAMWIVELNMKFFMGGCFVAAGALVAPTRHAWPAIMLLVLQLLGAGSGIALALMDRNADYRWQVILQLTVIGGALVGFFYARAESKERGIAHP
jgi:hypothetical protein